MKELGGLTLELQAEVNFHLLQALYAAEQEEWQIYGRIRNARTKAVPQEPAQK
ncbi:MAG TPA: hypothetical protein VKY85_21965 [Candidatus Angelobacter sp.]|nr:hypothetical protein [Candidatus Angelobacter sp.]